MKISSAGRLLLLYPIISFTISSYAQPVHSRGADTLLKNSTFDTSIIFNNFRSLNEYKTDRKLHLDQEIKELERMGIDKKALRYISDSIHFLNASLEQVLLFKTLCRMNKSESALISFNQFLVPAKFLSTQRLLTLFKQFPAALRNSVTGQTLYAKLRGYQVDDQSPAGKSFYFGNTRFQQLSGSYVRADQVISREKYKYYLVLFSASWCGPCRFEQQQLMRNFGKIDTSLIKLISISIDAEKTAWSAALEKDPVGWPTYLLENGANSAFFKENVPGGAIPCNFLLNADGALVDKKPDVFTLLEKTRGMKR
ncbi:MAG: thioredoxin family protein [Chitinophagaceae bacterium]|nr:thioredoxin family protein [Chitinophagaceae bacterium]